MKVLAVVTIYGELIGRSDDNQDDETLQTRGYVILKRPMKLQVVTIPTPQGIGSVNTMMPVSQLMELEELPIPLTQVVAVGSPHPDSEKLYLEMSSGIDLSATAKSNAKPSGLQIVK